MEYSVLDVILAVTTASAVMAGSVVVLRAASNELASVPAIDIGIAAPVRVVPVVDLDAPTLKLGGRRAEARLPKSWVKKPRPEPAAAGVEEPERKARPSTRASASEKDIPPPDVEVADAGAPPADAGAQPETDAGVPEDAGVAGDAAASEGDAGVTVEGDGGVGPVSSVAGPGHPDGTPDGTETDPLKARAADIYRSRLIAWFASRFRVSGSGIPQSTLTKLRVGATVQISGGRRVAGYTMTSSGNATFDAAARAALEGAKGQELPPPPENYPDLAQAQISLTFVCKEGRCD